MKMQRGKWPAVFLLFCAILTISGCPLFPPDEPYVQPPFVEIKDVSTTEPQLGDTVVIRWDYAPQNDQRNPKLARQVVQMHSLLLEGSIFSETEGCLPANLLPPGQSPLPCMSLDRRELSFQFKGPVMFNLIAFDQGGKRYEKLIKFKVRGAEFKLKAANLTNAGYPRWGNALGSIQNVDFERAFGIVEVGDANGAEDGVIDQIRFDPVLQQVFADGSPFFLSSNDVNERNAFRARRGSSFPILDPSFLSRPEGLQFNGRRTHSDILIFAGTIAVDGTVEQVKTTNGMVEVITASDLRNYEPVFIQVMLRSTDTSPQTLLVSDVYFGNINQGLVLATYRNHLSDNRTTGVYQLSVVPVADMFKSSGSIKGAILGANVTTLGNVFLVPAQADLTATWTNIPVYRDDNIDGLKASYVKFSR